MSSKGSSADLGSTPDRRSQPPREHRYEGVRDNSRPGMEYALLIYVPDRWNELPEDEREALYREYAGLRETPGFIAGAELEPVDKATTVRVEHGETLITDGPFAETKEVFGGYYLFEADDLEAAIRLAARIPAARIGGSVEIRPIVHR